MITLLKYTKESTSISDIQRLLLRVQFKVSKVKHAKAFTFQTSVKDAFFNFFFLISRFSTVFFWKRSVYYILGYVGKSLL